MTTITFYPLGSGPDENLETRINALAGQQREAENMMEGREEAVHNAEQAVAVAQEWKIDVVKTNLNRGDYTHIHKMFAENLVSAFHSEDSKLVENIRILNTLQAQYKARAEELVHLRRQFAETKNTGQYTLSRETLNELLGAVPHIKPDSGEVVEGTTTAFWTYSGVMMKPDKCTYSNIHKESRIPLSDITFSIDLQNGNMSFDTEGPKYVTMNTQWTTCHPHVLSGGKPCLGGFEFNVMEALEQGDVQLLAVLIGMFLAQANNDDGAGQHWPKWVPFEGKPRELVFNGTHVHTYPCWTKDSTAGRRVYSVTNGDGGGRIPFHLVTGHVDWPAFAAEHKIDPTEKTLLDTRYAWRIQ